MNQVERMNRVLYTKYPNLKFSVDAPLRKRTGIWYVDLKLGLQMMTYAWKPRQGFGIWTIQKKVAFGEGPHEVYKDAQQAADRIMEILTGGRREVPRREKTVATWLMGSLKSRDGRAAERRAVPQRRSR
jgi:hypothetical protein